MTTLQLYTFLMQETGLPEKAKQHLKIIEEQITWLTNLIQDTLEMTALDSGKAVSVWKPVALSTLVERAVNRYQSQAKVANLKLITQPSLTTQPTAEGDERRLVQALEEILENAITFTPAGGKISIETKTVEQKDSRDQVHTWATISVSDTGPGMTLEEQERAFDRFFRGTQAESGHIPGTGLGLSIAQAIVNAHGGYITVTSQIGEGSTFTIWMPQKYHL